MDMLQACFLKPDPRAVCFRLSLGRERMRRTSCVIVREMDLPVHVASGKQAGSQAKGVSMTGSFHGQLAAEVQQLRLLLKQRCRERERWKFLFVECIPKHVCSMDGWGAL